MAVSWTERHCERLGDPFGELSGEIELSEGGIVSGLDTRDGRKREFVVDAGIVNAERGRKEAVADDFVGDASTKGDERYGEA